MKLTLSDLLRVSPPNGWLCPCGAIWVASDSKRRVFVLAQRGAADCAHETLSAGHVWRG